MRVIAGKARRMSLITPKGLDVRPTTDRIKETLFNMIQNEIEECRFLDLFAGSGGIGIEALSRGARYCVFADKDKRSITCIRKNLEHTHLQDLSYVMNCDYRQALLRLRKMSPFDIIFLDPPYGKGLELEALRTIESEHLLSDEGLIIIESLIDTNYTASIPESLRIVREKLYKSNKHVFLRKESAE